MNSFRLIKLVFPRKPGEVDLILVFFRLAIYQMMLELCRRILNCLERRLVVSLADRLRSFLGCLDLELDFSQSFLNSLILVVGVIFVTCTKFCVLNHFINQIGAIAHQSFQRVRSKLADAEQPMNLNSKDINLIVFHFLASIIQGISSSLIMIAN